MSYDDGKLYAMTMGEFVSILIDSGGDPAVLVRVVENGPAVGDQFVRDWEIAQMPRELVTQTMAKRKPDFVSKVLFEFIKAGMFTNVWLERETL